MADNPFYKLEAQAKDRKIGEEEAPRIQSILEINVSNDNLLIFLNIFKG